MAIIKIKNPAIDLDAAEIPNLPASKITSGTLDNARISLDAAEIPNLDTAKITTGTLADARLPANALNSNVSIPNQSAFKNIIINGDMSIAQRSTSTASITANGYHTIDRMSSIIVNQGTWTQSQSTDVPTGQGFGYSLKMDCTTADASPAGGDIVRIQQAIEGKNLQYLKYGTSSAESTTLSFWVKSNKTGTYVIQLMNGAASRQVGKTYTISSANTWEKKTITFPGDTSTALDNDNSAELYVMFCLGTGSDRSSGTLSSTWQTFNSTDQFAGQTVKLADSTANEWYITGVQLEAGTSASDFEFLPTDVNENRCLRYFEYTTGANSHVGLYSTGSYIGHVFYKVRKRTRPTLSDWTGSSGSTLYNASGGDRGGTDSMFFTNSNGGSYVIVGKIDSEL